MAEKRSPRKSLRSTIAEARPRASPVGTLSGRNPEVVAAGEKLSKHHHPLDTGGGAACYNRDIASPDRFQLSPSGKCRFVPQTLASEVQISGSFSIS